MGKKLQLHIPTPCHEDWDNMIPVEKGKFCTSCQKPVIDFTGMSDAQVVSFFKKPSTGSVCGRFHEDQLSRDMRMPPKRLPWVKYFFQFTIPAFLISMKADAQKQKTGKIATAYVNETKSGIKINVPDTIPVATSVQTVMQLQQPVSVMVGGVVAEKVIVRHRKKRILNSSETICTNRSLKDSLRIPFARFLVYPNPVAPGQTITIANNKLVDDNYDIEIINQSGQSVHTEQFEINGKQKINLDIPFLPAGIYFIRFTGKKII
ncbi:MAG: T9SS type A sorting domain-containing protein [Bacteroidota bacterium]